MAVDLKNHPGLNPDYFADMQTRREVMAYNSEQRRRMRLKLPFMPQIPVPPQPNKYVPHIGAKQRAKGAKNAEK